MVNVLLSHRSLGIIMLLLRDQERRAENSARANAAALSGVPSERDNDAVCVMLRTSLSVDTGTLELVRGAIKEVNTEVRASMLLRCVVRLLVARIRDVVRI